jgi:hypothetical protein
MPAGYGYGVPPPPDPRFGPRVQPYNGGEVPSGFHTEDRARSKLVIAGAVTFLGAYLLSIISAAAYLGSDASQPTTSCSATFCSTSSQQQSPPGLGYLFVPLAGPWITLAKANLDSDDVGIPILILDGIAQAAGLGLFIAGEAARETVLVRDTNHAKLKLSPPKLIVGTHSAALRFAF